MFARKEAKMAPEDKYKFITNILNEMKAPPQNTDKKKTKIKERGFQKKTPQDLGPEDITVYTRDEGPSVQLCWRQ